LESRNPDATVDFFCASCDGKDYKGVAEAAVDATVLATNQAVDNVDDDFNATTLLVAPNGAGKK
jgi:hypothetical protein